MQDALRNIRIKEFDYALQAEQIAQFPLAVRDTSKLLMLRDGMITEDVFANVAAYLPADSLLISNETRVVHARLLFRKESGAQIEIFCLEPVSPSRDLQLALQQMHGCTWKCLVGNARRWKSGSLEMKGVIENIAVRLTANMDSREGSNFEIHFQWDAPQLSFSQILEHFGRIPLPPYIARETTDDDSHSYQTVFARNDGSVAAPTAGLHFTPEVLATLAEKNILTDAVTLHVGAGTFKPVTTETIGDHQMHYEQVVISIGLIKKILSYKTKHITLVGTTTVRTLESLYWQGVKWMESPALSPVMHINQWDPYTRPVSENISLEDALRCVIATLENFGLNQLQGQSSLMIAPGYQYRVPDAIITNFHQPRSTLLLLVSAFVGPDWEKAYQYALEHEFRFLSYGDSCLFFKQNQSVSCP